MRRRVAGGAAPSWLDDPRHRVRPDLAPHPAGDDGGEASCGAPRHHDHDLVDRGKLGHERLRVRFAEVPEPARLRPIGAGLEVAHAPPHRLEEMPLEVLLAPASGADGLGVLGPDDPQGVPVERKALVVPHAGRRPAQRGGELRRLAAQVIVDDEGPFAGKHRHRALLGRPPALDVERFPRRDLFVLADAVGVAAGMAQGGHGDLAGPRAPEIDHHEAEGAADGGIGAEPWPEDTGGAVDADAPAHRPVHDDEGEVALVVPDWPCKLKRGSQAASTTASSTGKYSGRQPAMTAFTASFSTVARPKLGGTSATSASRERKVACSMRSTRSRVGGTTGRPSVRPRSNQISISSAMAAPSIRMPTIELAC